MSTVRTQVEISGWEGLLPIERFIPLMERFAQIFETPLVAHVPQVRAKPRSLSEKEVFVEFFYRSSTGGDIEESSLRGVFSYESSQPLRCWRPHPSHPVYTSFRDFYGNLVAHREGNSIFIDFDFLRDSWEGHDDVLFLILWFLVPTPYDFSSSTFASGGHRLAQHLRSCFSETKEALKDAFYQFFASALKEALVIYGNKIASAAQTINSTEISYMRALREAEEVESFLEYLPTKLPSDDKLEQEFNELLRLPDITRVDALRYEDENKGKIRLTTGEVEQQIPAPPKKGKRYNIGSFTIDINPFLEINPTTVVATQILISQKDPGPFEKLYLATRSCLGTKEDRGLNYAAAKAMTKLAMVPLAVMVLTFLKYDTKLPTENVNVKTIPRKEGGASPKEMTEKEVGRERTRYVELMKKAWLRRLNKNASERLDDLRKQATSNLSEFCQQRTDREEFVLFLRFLKERLARAREESTRVFEELASHPSVAQIEIMGDGLRIWLQSEKIPYPRLLSINYSGLFRLISLNEFGSKGTNHSIIFSPQQDEDKVRKLIAGGNYPEALNMIVNQMLQPTTYIGGWG